MINSYFKVIMIKNIVQRDKSKINILHYDIRIYKIRIVPGYVKISIKHIASAFRLYDNLT